MENKEVTKLREENARLRAALLNFVENAVENKRLAQNQVVFYKGFFSQILKDVA